MASRDGFCHLPHDGMNGEGNANASDRNGRIRDLDGLLAELRAAEIEVMTKEEWDSMGIGRFARIHDPEGNPVELWEPA